MFAGILNIFNILEEIPQHCLPWLDELLVDTVEHVGVQVGDLDELDDL